MAKNITLNYQKTGQNVVAVTPTTHIAFCGGQAIPNNWNDLIGLQGDVSTGQTYTAHIKVPTGLQKVEWVVPQVSLASVSNKGDAVNAAWRVIQVAYSLDPNDPAGVVTLDVSLQVSDSDGYLEALSIVLQAGDGPADGGRGPSA